MLTSLKDIAHPQQVNCDVVVVGAGLAGLFLADDLVKHGMQVTVVESGSHTQDDDEHILNAVEQQGAIYDGAAHGRFRCLGGTSTRWGGALLPYLASDLAEHPLGWHQGWNLSSEALEVMQADVLDIFGFGDETFEGDEELHGLLAGYLPRLPKWPTFGKRSTANLFRYQLRKSNALHVWLDATVTKICIKDSRAHGVVAHSLCGKKLSVHAPTVVLCAGAIETTRLLMLMDRAFGGNVFPSNSPLGKGFHDHLSTPIADVVSNTKNDVTRMFSFRFVRGGMSNLRFELSPEERSVKPSPAAFLHVAFKRDSESGFDALRRLFQAVQQRRVPEAADIWQIVKDAPWFAEAVRWRFIEKRVLPPTGADFELHLVTEQQPHPDNHIKLSDNMCDSFGQPLAAINWSVRPEDQRAFLEVAAHAASAWKMGRLGELATLRLHHKDRIVSALQGGGGIYHPAGTTRIGLNASDGVVDRQLNVYGVPGLRALATSAFPSVGGTSPSLALIQLALRLSKDISRTCR